MDTPLKNKIAALATQFANEVVAAVSAALADQLDAGPARGTPGRPPGSRAARSPWRSPQDVRRAADRIVAVLGKQPYGIRAEELRASLGYSRAQMARPLGLVLQEGQVRKTGQRRRTVYRLAARQAPAAKLGKSPVKKAQRAVATKAGAPAPAARGKGRARKAAKAAKPSGNTAAAANDPG